ncbi:MAG TPA: DUF1003 domain-containing protein [Methanotrichaceae archaeon]|nr:DUF1003 domain-containing protein [Methanotrichaceae archaeon]HQF17674.1 DUF1003 domain-containing protein [Methanotrichaceae archaeon]HQI92262.1 DUF1003 domain-containing protein [Methanotrichaceae archaeon]
MKQLRFPDPFRHDHPPVRELADMDPGPTTRGERFADWVYDNVGSWRFILVQSALVAIWIILNVSSKVRPWDPYPFIFMNLIFSLQSAYTASVILMSQNRQDRLTAHNDFLTNFRSEEESRAVLEHLAAQDRALEEIYQELLDIKGERTRQITE